MFDFRKLWCLQWDLFQIQWHNQSSVSIIKLLSQCVPGIALIILSMNASIASLVEGISEQTLGMTLFLTHAAGRQTVIARL